MLAAILLLALPCLAVCQPATPTAKKPPAAVKTRTFEFTYAATVTGLDPGETAKLWVPVPPTLEEQDVKLVSREVKGALEASARVATEPRYGNQFAHTEVEPTADGKVKLRFVYRVTRREVKGETGKKLEDDWKRLARFLQADALVPIDGKPLELIKGRELPDDPLKKARILYDLVNNHMTYRKTGEGWGRGDSVWACDSKFGNCSDFHSLFISLARSQKLPAKFEIGFSLPLKRSAGAIGGYHCWAFFKPDGKAWVPVDISEANKEPTRKDYYFGNLSEDRVTFSTGRDIDLSPRQGGKPLNFFIYPHVEVGGKEHPQAKIEKAFGFKDVK